MSEHPRMRGDSGKGNMGAIFGGGLVAASILVGGYFGLRWIGQNLPEWDVTLPGFLGNAAEWLAEAFGDEQGLGKDQTVASASGVTKEIPLTIDTSVFGFRTELWTTAERANLTKGAEVSIHGDYFAQLRLPGLPLFAVPKVDPTNPDAMSYVITQRDAQGNDVGIDLSKLVLSIQSPAASVDEENLNCPVAPGQKYQGCEDIDITKGGSKEQNAVAGDIAASVRNAYLGDTECPLNTLAEYIGPVNEFQLAAGALISEGRRQGISGPVDINFAKSADGTPKRWVPHDVGEMLDFTQESRDDYEVPDVLVINWCDPRLHPSPVKEIKIDLEALKLGDRYKTLAPGFKSPWYEGIRKDSSVKIINTGLVTANGTEQGLSPIGGNPANSRQAFIRNDATMPTQTQARARRGAPKRRLAPSQS